MARIRLGILGASGRMGRAVAALVAEDYADRAEIVAGVDSDDGELDQFASVDVVIDVSLPEGTASLVDWLSAHEAAEPALVSGTTGLDDRLLARLDALGDSRRVLHSANFSNGVAALNEIVAFAAPLLGELGYTPVITETHHAHKLDAPSGTARALQQTLAPDAPDSVETHSVRTGEVVGRHELAFIGTDDRIELIHDAGDRRLFARGAIEAALWISAQTGTGADTMKSYFRKRFAALV